MKSFTALELVKLCDLPLYCKKSVKTAYPGILLHRNPLIATITGMVLSYELWLSDYCSDKGGLDISP